MLKKIVLLLSLIPSCVNAASVSEELENAISEKLDVENIYVSLYSKSKFKDDAKVTIDDLKLEERAKRFTATVNLDGKVQKVAGRYELANRLPVLKNSLPAGSLISAENIDFIKIPASREITKFCATEEDLAGKITKKRLLANQLINSRDISSPAIIQKGSSVKMLFSKGNLAIEAQGLALESGGKDDFIKVKNLSSNKIVQGKVIDEGTVSTGG